MHREKTIVTSSKAYSRELAEKYDYRHFGGQSGQFILSKDVRTLLSLLPPPPALVLDIPCGTGVYTDALTKQGYRTIAADASGSMLQIAGLYQPQKARLQADIAGLPVDDNALDIVVTLRLFSHFESVEIARSLRELGRVIKPGGRVIFDSFRWTPRRWPVLRSIVEQSYIHEYSYDEKVATIVEAGLSVVDTRWSYLFSPILQRRLPASIVRGLDRFETLLPDRWLLRTFWACTKH